MYLNSYIAEIKNLCKKYNVKHLYAFGSVLSDDQFNSKSDVDFLVDIYANDPIEYAENYFDLKFNLEDLLKRQIDLLEQKSLINKYLAESINNSKQVIYEA